MAEKTDEKENPAKEDCWGIIVINKKDECWIQMYKEGDLPKPLKVDELDNWKFRNKDKDKKIKALVKTINDNKLLLKDEILAVNGLIISAHEDFENRLEQFNSLGVSSNLIKFIGLPEKGKDLIGDIINRSISYRNQSSHTDLQTKDRFDSHTSPREEQCSANESDDDNQIVDTSHNNQPEDRDCHSTNSHYQVESSQDMKEQFEDNSDKGVAKEKSTEYDTDKQKEVCNTEREETSILFNLDKKIDKISGLMEQLINNNRKFEEKITNKMKNLEAKMTDIDEKLSKELKRPKERVENTFNRSISQRGTAPQPPSKPTFQGLRCYFHPAPDQVKKIQAQFATDLKQRMTHEKLQLLEDPSGPTVAFAVNGSRLHSDIQRDLKSDTSTGPIFLLIIKPTMKPGEMHERLIPDSLGIDRVKEACYLLVDINNTRLHRCDTNEESVNTVILFLRTYNGTQTHL